MKELIIKKASEMFITLGFKSVTMDDIATEMGISKKTIYANYNNKETMVAVVIDSIFEEVSGKINRICELKKNPIEEIYEVKKCVMESMRDEKTSPWHQLQKYYPSIHQNIKARQFGFMQECVVKNLTRGLEQQLYRANIDVQFVARIYFNGITGIKEENLFPVAMFTGLSLYEMYLEYHLRGIVTPKGRTVLNKLIHSTQD